MSHQSLTDRFSNELKLIDESLVQHWQGLKWWPDQGVQRLKDSVLYSLESGGKRFRPLLSVLTAQALGKDSKEVLPWASGVEFIHTYSLIHDDLPCMDDDAERRGHPTNHIKFDEATALLAGDALLTEAFHVVAQGYTAHPARGMEAVALLAQASGSLGMIGGQMLDIFVPEGGHNDEQIRLVHELKTGALIRVAVEGAACVLDATPEQRQKLTEFAEILGFAFQLADDIDDWDEAQPEPTSYINVFGLEATRTKLDELTKKSISLLDDFGPGADGLTWIAQFNQNRI